MNFIVSNISSNRDSSIYTSCRKPQMVWKRFLVLELHPIMVERGCSMTAWESWKYSRVCSFISTLHTCRPKPSLYQSTYSYLGHQRFPTGHICTKWRTWHAGWPQTGTQDRRKLRGPRNKLRKPRNANGNINPLENQNSHNVLNTI